MVDHFYTDSPKTAPAPGWADTHPAPNTHKPSPTMGFPPHPPLQLDEPHHTAFREAILKPVTAADEESFGQAFLSHVENITPGKPLSLTIAEVKMVMRGVVAQLHDEPKTRTKIAAAELIKKLTTQTGVHPD